MRLRKKKSIKKRVELIEKDINLNGGYFQTTTKDRLDDGNRRLIKLEVRLAQIEKIIEDAGIIEELDMSDVQYRDKEIVLSNGLFGPQSYTVKAPYVINSVKVK